MTRRISGALLVGLTWLASALPAQAISINGSQWAQLDKGEILVTIGPATAGPRLYQALGEVDATPEQVYKMLVDFDNHEKTYTYVSKSGVKSRAGSRMVVSKELSLPWPASSRWFVTNVELHPEHFGYDWRNVDGNAGRQFGSYTCQKRGNKTLVAYQIHFNKEDVPWLPGFLFNLAQRVALPGIIKDIRKAAPRY